MLYVCTFADYMIRICAVKPARKQTTIELLWVIDAPATANRVNMNLQKARNKIR
jgi:hypothetical protein